MSVTHTNSREAYVTPRRHAIIPHTPSLFPWNRYWLGGLKRFYAPGKSRLRMVCQADMPILPVQFRGFFPMFIENSQFLLGLLNIRFQLAHTIRIAESSGVCQRSVEAVER